MTPVPFTLSHPAAVALVRPWARRAELPLAALAIGTMTPDFEFFLHLRPLTLWSHSLTGLATFCLPVGLLVLAAWELLAREPVRHLLGFPAEATHAPRQRGWWGRATAGVALGALTHLFWDGFTHGGYWGAQLLPALRAPAPLPGGYVIPWFNLLQHASTIAGGVVVLGWLAREGHRAGALATWARPTWRWAALPALAVAAGAIGWWNGARWGAPADYWSAQLWLGRVAVGTLLGLGVAMLAFSVAHRIVVPAGQEQAT